MLQPRLKALKIHDFANYLKGFHIPSPLFFAFLSKTTEFCGGIFLVAGLFIRPACVFMIVNMTVATFVTQRGDLLGDAIHTFLLLLICVVLFFSKIDRYALDWIIWTKSKNK